MYCLRPTTEINALNFIGNFFAELASAISDVDLLTILKEGKDFFSNVPESDASCLAKNAEIVELASKFGINSLDDLQVLG